ncbi:hypothetical protein ES705_07604 [subsurface metagenome]|nr:hypothetical protein [Methanosarcinales archaeon]
MAINILALIADIVGIGTGLSKVIETIDNLRFKWHVKGKELEQLKKDVGDISDKIVYVKKISDILEGYKKYYLNAYEIYSSSDKLREYIQNNFEDLSEQKSEKWFILEDKLEEIKRTKAKNIKIILGGINYLDAHDAGQITVIATSLNDNFNAADTLLPVRDINKFKASIKLLSDDALKLYNIYDDSINKMIKGLGGV